ncbi:hypothetical protein Patl1_13827 [Pistacia atlantica]|uniref:Uncharacterized protein n=1 Tax=Pistacia atlantica TaxID=434234 RepID=A0ACC1AX04_9ROSI|nr:hypothetical protein Patl1_13827 [Pistacia atlantica]
MLVTLLVPKRCFHVVILSKEAMPVVKKECLWCDLCFECFGDAEVGGNADGSGGEEVIPCDGGIAGAIVGGISVSGGEGNGAKWSGDEVNGGNEGSLGLGKGGISCECDNWFMDWGFKM